MNKNGRKPRQNPQERRIDEETYRKVKALDKQAGLAKTIEKIKALSVKEAIEKLKEEGVQPAEQDDLSVLAKMLMNTSIDTIGEMSADKTMPAILSRLATLGISDKNADLVSFVKQLYAIAYPTAKIDVTTKGEAINTSIDDYTVDELKEIIKMRREEKENQKAKE